MVPHDSDGFAGPKNFGGRRLMEELSLLLFQAVKPKCIELNQVALLPEPVFKGDSIKLVNSLRAVVETLEEHFKNNNIEGWYQLSSNLADYIFFPLSSIIKKQDLSKSVVTYVLKILGFLISNAWGQGQQQKLFDQLYPVVLHLVKSQIKDQSMQNNGTISIGFELSSVQCILAVATSLPDDYFVTDPKRLSFLGPSIEYILDTLQSLKKNGSEESTKCVILILQTIRRFVKLTKGEQLSYIFPGVTSSLINYFTQSKGVNYTVICGVIDTMKGLIVKVFADDSLRIDRKSAVFSLSNLESLNEQWQAQNSTDNESMPDFSSLNIVIEIPSSAKHHRTSKWLQATSKQLKVFITTFFQSLFNFSQNEYKLKTKHQITESILSFIRDIFLNCFISLYENISPVLLDVVPMMIASLSYDDLTERPYQSYDEILATKWAELISEAKFGPDSYDETELKLMLRLLKFKLNDLIDNKFSTIMFSIEEKKINTCIISVKFHLTLLKILSLKNPLEENNSSTLQQKLIKKIRLCLLKVYIFNLERKESRSSGLMLHLNNDADDFGGDSLDDIKLPPHINANAITNFKKELYAKNSNFSFSSSNFSALTNAWSLQKLELLANSSEGYFADSFSLFIERQLSSLVIFAGKFDPPTVSFLMETLLLNVGMTDHEPSSEPIDMLISTWMSKSLLSSFSTDDKVQNKSFDIDEFLTFNEDDDLKVDAGDSLVTSHEEVPSIHEVLSYMLLSRSQNLLDRYLLRVNEPKAYSKKNSQFLTKYRIDEISLSIAIESVGAVSSFISKDDFQIDLLMEYLYVLLEALTYQASPIIQKSAMSALSKIAQNYYGGSLESLILENSDYLIDSLSLRFSISASLSPFSANILFIILKISGIKLLLSNQLTSIVSQMFVLIDSYHGYTTLVEGFFCFFQELIRQIKAEYLKSQQKLNVLPSSQESSAYSPWGMDTLDDLLTFLDSSSKLIDPFADNYESSQEYFTRKPGTPFADQLGDSDDEAEDDGEEKESHDTWSCIVPKDTYMLVQQIFNYGFRLLTSPSMSLKCQILRTLIDVYPVLATNYRLCQVCVVKDWFLLETLVTSSFHIDLSLRYNHNLVTLAIELMTMIFEEDGKQQEYILSKRYIDVWNRISSKGITKNQHKHSKKVNSSLSSNSASTQDKAMIHTNPNLGKSLVILLLRGFEVYEKWIPDITAYEIVKFCNNNSIQSIQTTSQKFKNLQWVIDVKYKQV